MVRINIENYEKMARSTTFSDPIKRSLFPLDKKHYILGYMPESKPQKLTIGMICIQELAHMNHE